MSQVNVGDFPIDPQVTSGTQLAEILNRWFNASETQNSGATPPPTTYPGMFWYDTSVSPPILKVRNAGNSGWVTMAQAANIQPGDITGLGTMAQVNSPAPVANGGTGSTTAAGARTNLGLDTTYVRKTGDTMTGNLIAPSFALDGDTYFTQDANNNYLNMAGSWFLYWAKASGLLAWQHGPSGPTTYFQPGGDFQAAGNSWTSGGNMGMVVTDPARRYIRFATDGWRLEWLTANGSLQYTRNDNGLAWRCDASGNIYANGVHSATYHTSRNPGNPAFNVEGYADWGGGLLGRTIIDCNPGWNQITMQALHYQGNWAGLRFWSPTGTMDLVMSSNPVQIRGATIDRATAANNSDALGGRSWDQYLHNNGAGNPRYIRNQGVGFLIAGIDGYGEVNWPVGPSDERLKHQIAATKQDSLKIIQQLPFIEFSFHPIHNDATGEDFHVDDEHLHELGLSAQKAQAIDRELVSDVGTYLQLIPQELALLALHGVQQLLARVVALEAA